MAAMSCVDCARPMARNSENCLYCGGKGAERIQVEKPLSCPRCKTSMDKINSEGLLLDICGDCGGTWYDIGELESYLEKTRDLADDEVHDPSEGVTHGQRTPASAVKRVYLPCPHCKDLMSRTNYGRGSGIMVDLCGAHGVYLDPEEFEQLRRFIADGGRVHKIGGAISPGTHRRKRAPSERPNARGIRKTPHDQKHSLFSSLRRLLR